MLQISGGKKWFLLQDDGLLSLICTCLPFRKPYCFCGKCGQLLLHYHSSLESLASWHIQLTGHALFNIFLPQARRGQRGITLRSSLMSFMLMMLLVAE